MASIRFRNQELLIRLPALLAVLGVASLTASAGIWQLSRAEQKRALQRDYESRQALPVVAFSLGPAAQSTPRAFSAVTVHGKWARDMTVFEDNQIFEGRPGFRVYTPLCGPEQRRCVLVERGWVALSGERASLPAVETPSDEVTIEALVDTPSPRFIELDAQVQQGKLWQNVTVERFRAASGLVLMPFMLRQRSVAPDGLNRFRPAPDFGVAKHESYALQWFSFTLLTLVLSISAGFRKRDT